MDPHPRLVPFLTQYNVTYADFVKQGRPAKGSETLVEVRKAVVTTLHEQGTSWADMRAITGLSNGSIQRLTGAMWNPASRDVVRENGVRLGRSWKGKPRPGQLERQWSNGTFDNLRGRVRPEEERQHLRDSWTPERRLEAAAQSQRNWSDPVVRTKIMAFHTNDHERVRRSQAQVRRMKEHPDKYMRGKASWVDTPKGLTERAYVRSSYELAAVQVLESDTTVVRYEHERVLFLPNGRWILPDFIVEHVDSTVTLVEVKSAWVLSLPANRKEVKRLNIAKDFAASQGWGFKVWTERELSC